MPFAGSDIQRMIYDRLVSQVAGLNIYAGIRPEATLPYCVIGQNVFSRNDTKDVDIERVSVQIDVWTDSNSFTSVNAFINSIKNALHRQETALNTILTTNSSNWYLIECVHEQSQSFVDVGQSPVGQEKYVRGIMEFTMLIEDNTA